MLVPQIAQIELTTICNHRCRYCGYARMSREKRHMPIDDVRKIIDKVYAAGILFVRVFNMGESSLHPDFIEALKYIREQGMVIFLATNMTGINPEVADWIIENFQLWDLVVIDIDSVVRDTYIQLKGVDTFEKVKTNTDYFIRRFLESRGEFGVMIKMLLYPQNDTEEEKSAFREYFQRDTDLNYSVEIHYPNNWAGKFETYGDTGHRDDDICSRLLNEIVILVNGDVVMCCLDYDAEAVIGNIFENDLIEIFNSEAMQNLRDNFPTGPCVVCDERSRWAMDPAG